MGWDGGREVSKWEARRGECATRGQLGLPCPRGQATTEYMMFSSVACRCFPCHGKPSLSAPAAACAPGLSLHLEVRPGEERQHVIRDGPAGRVGRISVGHLYQICQRSVQPRSLHLQQEQQEQQNRSACHHHHCVFTPPHRCRCLTGRHPLQLKRLRRATLSQRTCCWKMAAEVRKLCSASTRRRLGSTMTRSKAAAAAAAHAAQ